MKPVMETHIYAHRAARWIAKKAVEQELREQGVRVTLVRPAIIAEKARAYLGDHPESGLKLWNVHGRWKKLRKQRRRLGE